MTGVGVGVGAGVGIRVAGRVGVGVAVFVNKMVRAEVVSYSPWLTTITTINCDRPINTLINS